METVTFLTPKQAAKRERDKKIQASFKALRHKYPDIKSERIICEIAKDYNLTNAAIRSICKKEGLC